MKIAIIGAGAAGLAALRHSLQEKHECQLFEQTGVVGGTWNYTDKTGIDEFGLPIHSSMYKGLRTNLPKELMQFEDFPFQTPEHSYVTQPDVLKYINDFTQHFNLLPHIQFFKNVIRVSPLQKGRWSVEVRDLKLDLVETREFDAIIICIGNYSVPSMPTFPGIEKFQGTAIHSHAFRDADTYENQKVLIIGSGPSGLDISRLIHEVSNNNVILCHRSPIDPRFGLSEAIRRKPEIKTFNEHSVTFVDGSEEQIDTVIFCTGYVYSYPFLSKDCDIRADDKWVRYLYKQIININHPTMGFIGIPFKIFPFVIFGIQVRFFLAALRGNLSKTKEEMMDELLTHMNKQKEQGIPPSKAHFLYLAQGEYMDDLAMTANIKKVPSVFIKLYKYVHGEGKMKHHLSYRLINDEEFGIIENCK